MQQAVCVLIASIALSVAGAPLAAQTIQAPQASGGAIASLDQAIAAAIAASPALRAAETQIEADRQGRAQAGVLPNPEFSLGTENVAGSGPYQGFRSAETTAGLSWRIELGGKRGARSGVADAGVGASRAELSAARLDLYREVTRAYIDLLAAQRAIALEQERAQLAGDMVRVARARVDAGREPLIQVRKAEVVASTAAIALTKSERLAAASRSTLSRMAGGRPVQVQPDAAWYEDLGPDPAAQPVTSPAPSSPDLLRRKAEIERSQAQFRLQQTEAVPDVTVNAGVRRYSDSSDTVFLVGLSVPIPVLNRNQGGIERSRLLIGKSELEAQQAERQLVQELGQAQAELEIAWREARSLKEVVLPAAEAAFGFAREGYAGGKFPFLDVLDAQRTLFDAKAQLNDALRDFHLRKADRDRLRGEIPAVR